MTLHEKFLTFLITSGIAFAFLDFFLLVSLLIYLIATRT